MVSNHINTSNNRTEFKCSLCGKSLINRDPSEIIQESISGSKYFFDTNQCVTMFKRLDHFYGKNITSFTGNTEIISDPFWNKIAPSYDEIREIDIESKDHYIHVIKNPQEALATAIQLVRSAEKEILLLFSSANAFYRRINQADGFELIKKIKDDPSKNVNIRILTPFDEKIQTTVDNLKNDYSIDVEYLPEPLHLNITILITDRRFSLAVELQKEKDSAEDSIDAMGLSTYSNSKSTVLYYVSIFENLWKQADIYKKADDLYRQLKETHQTQRQFINEAAHEIRNPIQPILGLAEVMLSNKNLDPDKKEDLLRIIVSNAKKLQFLTDNLLDVARIDGQLLTLNLEEFDLMESIRDLLRDLENQTKGKNISLVLNSKEKSVKLVADKLRVNQVFLNIINNAINILQEGQVIVSVQSQNNDVLVKITDNGPGIHSKIKDKLFTKFVTGSKSGTGLGLYICKNIIEKHGGKIWAENNQDKGATFSFTVPIKTEK